MIQMNSYRLGMYLVVLINYFPFALKCYFILKNASGVFGASVYVFECNSNGNNNNNNISTRRPPLWSSGQRFWLQIQRSRVRSPALPDFLSSSGSGTGSTQPREVKLRSYLNKKSSGSRFRKQRLTAVGTRCANRVTPLYPQNLALVSLCSLKHCIKAPHRHSHTATERQHTPNQIPPMK